MSQQAQQAGAAGSEKKREEKPQFPAPKFDIDIYSKTYTGHGRINRLKFIGEVGKTKIVFISYLFVVLQGCCPYCVQIVLGGTEEDHEHCSIPGGQFLGCRFQYLIDFG